MEDLKQVGSAEIIRKQMAIVLEATNNTLHFNLRILKHYQLRELIQVVKPYILDNGVKQTCCFKLCGIDLISKIPAFAFTDPIDMQVEVVQLHSLPFETKLFLIEIIEKL